MNLTVQVHNDEEGGYWAEVQEIPGCITQGETVEELEANVRELIEQCLEGLIQDYVDSLTTKVEIEPGESTWTIAVKLEHRKSHAKQ